MKAVVVASNKDEALVGAFSVITNLCVDLRLKLYSLDPHLPPPHSLEAVPSVSDRDLCWPDLAECSRLLASHQLSRIFLSLTPRLRLEPWTLLYALSRCPGSYN